MGHGIGMSQNGARDGKKGKIYIDILTLFFPALLGTSSRNTGLDLLSIDKTMKNQEEKGQVYGRVQ